MTGAPQTLWPLSLFSRSRQSLGGQGERYAAWRLRWRGYRIVAQGERSRYGEIDIIAVHRRTVVFVEVKTRRSNRSGAPAEAVGPEKQRRIASSALAFLKAHGLLEHPARFDVVAMVWPAGAARPTSYQHIKDAFSPAGIGQYFA